MRMLRRGCEGAHVASRSTSASTRSAPRWRSTRRSSTVAIHAQVIARNLDAFVDLLARLLGDADVPRGRARAPEARDAWPRSSRRATTTASSRRRRMQRTLFEGHPYGRELGGHDAERAGASTRDDVRAFYRRYVVPDEHRHRHRRRRRPTRRRRRIAARLVARPAARASARPTRSRSRRCAPGRRLLRRRQARAHADADPRRHARHVARTTTTTSRSSSRNAVFGGTFTSRLMRRCAPSAAGRTARARAPASTGGGRRGSCGPSRPPTDAGALPRAVARAARHLGRRTASRRARSRFIQRYLVRSHAFDVDTAHQAAAPGARRRAARRCRPTTSALDRPGARRDAGSRERRRQEPHPSGGPARRGRRHGRRRCSSRWSRRSPASARASVVPVRRRVSARQASDGPLREGLGEAACRSAPARNSASASTLRRKARFVVHGAMVVPASARRARRCAAVARLAPRDDLRDHRIVERRDLAARRARPTRRAAARVCASPAPARPHELVDRARLRDEPLARVLGVDARLDRRAPCARPSTDRAAARRPPRGAAARRDRAP